VNIAVTTGTPPTGPNVQDEDTETVTFDQNPSIDLNKIAAAGPFVVGDTIDYDYTVTNIGNVTLTSVTLVDDILGTITLTTTELAPGDSATGTASHLVTQDDVDAGSIVNVAVTTGTPPIGPDVQDDDTETVNFDQNPSIVLDKVAADGPFVVGDTIDYDYTVTNNGNVTLTSVTLIDDILGTITLTTTELAPGDSATGTASHLVTQDDMDAGEVVNEAIATGTPPSGPAVFDSDTETVGFDQNPSILLDKVAEAGSFVVGDTITYDYTVTNNGNVTLTSVTLVDDILGTITLTATELAPGDSATGTASHTVTQDDVDAGEIVNIAVATGTPPIGPNVQDDDTETVTLVQDPSIALDKVAEAGSFAVGDVITYDYTVTNNGNVTLTNVTLVDDILGTITLTGTELAPGDSVTGTASHTVTQDDVDAGQIVNIANATGTPPVGPAVEDEDTETVLLNQSASILVEKAASEGPFVVGDVITYDYTVTNNGNVTLTNVTLVDDILRDRHWHRAGSVHSAG